MLQAARILRETGRRRAARVHLSNVAGKAPRATLDESDARQLFHHLIHADAQRDTHAVAARLINRHATAAAATPLPEWWPADGAAFDLRQGMAVAAAWRLQRLEAWEARLPNLPVDQHVHLLLQLAPSLAIDGCWLQHASSALNSHLPSSSLLLRSYLRRMHRDAGRYGSTFIAALCAIGIVLPSAGSQAFASHPALASEMFELPAMALALSQFPSLLLPELLGFNLHAAQCGAEPLLAIMGPALLGTSAVRQFCSGQTQQALVDDALQAIDAALQERPPHPQGAPGGSRPPAELRLTAADHHQAVREGIARGVQIAQALAERREAALAALASGTALDPASRMAQLLRRKAAVAKGYHGRVRLGGRPLDALFAEAGQAPAALMQALAGSHHVKAGDPANSPLATSLVSPRGVMAGIFDAEELQTLQAWISALPAQTLPSWPPLPPPRPYEPAEADGEQATAGGLLDCLPSDDADRRCAQLPLRELYHRLLHVETYPEALPYARSFAALWLARAGAQLEKGHEPLPFATYDHHALDTWLQQRHQIQLNSYAASAEAAPAPPTREALIESCLQLCPAVYMDGAWLQRVGQASVASSEVGRRLYDIYLDEVGRGSTLENHPNLYRELMAAMEVPVPTFGSPEFAHWPRFDEASFRLPVFWLCLSLHPRHFLSETLGLTLAVELSGVGSTYRSSRDALRHHGYPSTFVDVHNTIDNVSSGHTALALEAIKLHMDEGLEAGGHDEVQRRWRRVWTGWRAITPPPGIG